MRRILSHRLGGVVLLGGLVVGLALATRVALLVTSWRAVDARLGVLIAAFLALPAIAWLVLVPQRAFAQRLHRVAVGVFFLAVPYALCFLGVAEWFSWNEFETRFNFIAVDYLLYTREVLGNIWESYPIPFLLAAIGVVSAGLLLVFWRHADVEAFLRSRTPARERLVDELSSQIDLAPTLLSLLHWNYESRFFGKDVLAMQTADERAFVSTYEAIAYYQSADALYGLHRDEAAAR